MKVKCVRSHDDNVIVGKVYEIKNGCIEFENEYYNMCDRNSVKYLNEVCSLGLEFVSAETRLTFAELNFLVSNACPSHYWLVDKECNGRDEDYDCTQCWKASLKREGIVVDGENFDEDELERKLREHI